MKLSLLACLLFFSCAVSRNGNSNCFQELKSEIALNWKFVPDSSFYKADKEFLKRLDSSHYRNCIIGMSKQEITDLFGAPEFIPSDWHYPYKARYKTSRPCAHAGVVTGKDSSLKPFQCSYLDFYFDSAYKVVNFMGIYTWLEMDK
jgi:hypothetical protein